MGFRYRLARMIAPEYRSADNAILIADALQLALATPSGHVAALEACASLVSRSLMACEVSGAARLRFPVTVLRDIGRDLIVRGEYAGLLDLPLVHVLGEYRIKRGRLEYHDRDADGREIKRASSDYLHILWTDSADGNGKSALENARQLWRIASHAERVMALELSGTVGSVIPMPTGESGGRGLTAPHDTERYRADTATRGAEPANFRRVIIETLRGLKGNTALLPTHSGSVRDKNTPDADYKQAKLQPRIDPQTPVAHGRAYDDVLRAVGIHPLMMSATLPPTREIMRLHCCMTIEPICRLIESYAADKGMAINISTEPLMRYDVAGTARAFGVYVQAGLSLDEAAEQVGIELGDALA